MSIICKFPPDTNCLRIVATLSASVHSPPIGTHRAIFLFWSLSCSESLKSWAAEVKSSPPDSGGVDGDRSIGKLDWKGGAGRGGWKGVWAMGYGCMNGSLGSVFLMMLQFLILYCWLCVRLVGLNEQFHAVGGYVNVTQHCIICTRQDHDNINITIVPSSRTCTPCDHLSSSRINIYLQCGSRQLAS